MVLLRGVIIFLSVFFSTVAVAQSWSVRSDDNGGYAVASVVLPVPSMSMTCHARSVQNLPLMQTGWHESSIAPPYQFIFGFSPDLIDTRVLARDDLILFVDQTGYQLPLTYWNELEGEWEITLPMSDPVFAAMNGAARMVLQVGTEAAWEFPVAGLATSLEQARQYCAGTWVRTGFPPPAWFGPVAGAPKPGAGAFQLPSQVQAYANGQCEGLATIAPGALQAGDLDGDGAPDVVLNWREVTCAGQSFNGFCGAANCSIDVFMSTRGYVQPVQMLGLSAGIGPHRTGRLALAISGTYGLCGETGCDDPWVWNGATLVQQP